MDMDINVFNAAFVANGAVNPTGNLDLTEAVDSTGDSGNLPPPGTSGNPSNQGDDSMDVEDNAPPGPMSPLTPLVASPISPPTPPALSPLPSIATLPDDPAPPSRRLRSGVLHAATVPDDPAPPSRRLRSGVLHARPEVLLTRARPRGRPRTAPPPPGGTNPPPAPGPANSPPPPGPDDPLPPPGPADPPAAPGPAHPPPPLGPADPPPPPGPADPPPPPGPADPPPPPGPADPPPPPGPDDPPPPPGPDDPPPPPGPADPPPPLGPADPLPMDPPMDTELWKSEYKEKIIELGTHVKKHVPIPPEHLPLFDNFIARMRHVGRLDTEIERVSNSTELAKLGRLFKADWNKLLSMFSAPARGEFGSPSSSTSTVFPPVDKYPHSLALIHQRLDNTDYRLDMAGPLLSEIAAAAGNLRCGITVYTSPLMYSTSHSQGAYGTWASFLKCPRDYGGDISACVVGGYKLPSVGTPLDQFFGQDFHVFLIIAIHPPRVGSPAQRPPRSFALFDINSGPVEARAKSLVQWGVPPNVLSMLRSDRHGKVFANIRSPHREDRNDDGQCYYRTMQKLLGFLALGVDGLGIQRDSRGNVQGMVGFRPIDID